VPRWVTVFGQVKHLGADADLLSLACLGCYEYAALAGGSKQAYRVIHQPVGL